jgi:DNA-binding LacI/PurR family transcriptional regulator
MYMPPTIKDIAKKAGVSHATVSRALNGNPSIPEKTAAGIRVLADEMGYLASAPARGLKTKRSQAVGVVVSRIDNPYFGEIIQGIEDTLKPSGFSLFIASSHLDFSIEKNIVQAFAEHRVDGVIICSVSFSREYADLIKNYGIPIVVVNNESSEEFDCSISHDDFNGARQVTRHLIDLGHSRVGYLGNSLANQINNDRLQGFFKELTVSNITIDPQTIVNTLGSEIENGEEAMLLLLKTDPLPTAVFCFNDLMAIGALKVIRNQNLRVPEDISIVGFDNIPYSAYTSPALTTFDQPKRKIGSEAAQMLLEQIHSSNCLDSHIARTMQGHLLIRESTSSPKVKE